MREAAVCVQNETTKKVSTVLGGLDDLREGNSMEDDYFWLAFLIGDTGYAINAKYVTRVIALREIVPFENAPAYCPGVIWDRKGLIRLLDLRSLFGLGDYLSSLKNERDKLPKTIVIELDGRRRGIIVDQIVSIEHFYNITGSSSKQSSKWTSYSYMRVKSDLLDSPAFVIGPENLRAVEFENSNTKIDWGGRFDIRLKG